MLKDIAIGRAPRELDEEDSDVQMDYAGVVNGEEPLMISYAGGELEALRAAGPNDELVGGFYKL